MFDFGDFTITKREILVSIIILALMLTLGFVIHGAIDHSMMIKHQEYNTALRIDGDAEMFSYAMQTNIGNAYVYGTWSAVDPVYYDEVDGNYSYIEKVKERYTRHTRTVTKTRTLSNGETQTYTEEEEYWTWDRVDSWSKHCSKINFVGSEFDYGVIERPSTSHIATIRESGHIRYKYYGAPWTCEATIYADLRDGTVNSVDTYHYKTIEETHKQMTSKGGLVVFWVLWSIFMILVIGGFFVIDNYWLEDRRH